MSSITPPASAIARPASSITGALPPPPVEGRPVRGVVGGSCDTSQATVTSNERSESAVVTVMWWLPSVSPVIDTCSWLSGATTCWTPWTVNTTGSSPPVAMSVMVSVPSWFSHDWAIEMEPSPAWSQSTVTSKLKS